MRILKAGFSGQFKIVRKGDDTMARMFNIHGICKAHAHYMVDLTPRLLEIKKMIDAGAYFTINRARQYGKTTVLRALTGYLQKDYVVVSLDFQRMSSADFENESAFVHALAREVSRRVRILEQVPEKIKQELYQMADYANQGVRMAEMFDCFCAWCSQTQQPVVLLVDEADTATNNQVFVDFLAQLRAAYLERDVMPSFQSVILASVYDIRSVKRKLHPDGEHRENSPWNIAAKFRVDMEFSVSDIKGMLVQYEADHHTGMDLGMISALLFDYTAGYPYLVSWLCKCMDEDLQAAWTKDGFLEAVKMLLEDQNPLFASLISKINEFEELNGVIVRLLFQGQSVAYNADDVAVQNAIMFGFVKISHSTVQIANRIFESRLYNWYLLGYQEQNSEIYAQGVRQKNQFFTDGFLNVRLVLEKFVEAFHDLYGEKNRTFLEDEGRRYFMLFLKPIINGVGNCSVEPRTRNNERMDLVIDYHGERSIIEMKIWRGNAYHERGEKQLSDYLDYFHLKKGYMLSFNFNKKKEIGVKEVVLGDKLLIEAVV